MKQSSLLTAVPLLLLAAPAFAQAPAGAPPPVAPPAPAPLAPETPAETPAVTLAPAPPPPPGAGAVAPPAAPVAEVAAKEEKPADPDKLAVAKTGFFQPSANLQVWAIAEHLGNARTDKDAWGSSFRVRRAELKAKGEIIPKKFGYQLMFDVARLLDLKSTAVNNVEIATTAPDGTMTTTTTTLNTLGTAPAYGGSTMLTGANTSILQDVQLTYMTDYADFSIGQFKIPVSYEGSGSASKLIFPERALISRAFGDKRDIGFKVEKKFEYFGYLAGVYNGAGQNNIDGNDQKDLALRLEAYPIKDLTLAVVGYTSVGDRDLPGTKDRIEGDIKFEKSNFLLQAEAIRAWDVVGTAAAHTKVEGQGFYVLAGYTFFDSLQPVLRIGSVDPEVGKDEGPLKAVAGDSKSLAPNDEITAYELAVNYYLKKHDAKVQLSGSFFDPEQRESKTTFDLILATQIAF
jgi:hypothetical protein